MALDEREGRRDADDDVREVAPGGLAQAQAQQLDVLPDPRDRPLGGRARAGGRAVHEHVRVDRRQAPGGHERDRGDDQRGDRVGLGDARVDREQARRAPPASRPCRPRSAARWRPARGSTAAGRRRSEAAMRARSSPIATPITANWYQRIWGGGWPSTRCSIACTATTIAARDQDRRLAERAEVLGAPVPVGVAAVRGPPAEAHREERDHRRDDVAAGLDPGGDQREARGREPHAELQRDEDGRDGDRGERRAALLRRRIVGPGGCHRCRLIPRANRNAGRRRLRCAYRGPVAGAHPGHSHTHGADAEPARLAWALALIAGLMAVEIAAGVIADSLALLSDAAHMLTDAAAIALSLLALRLARAPGGRLADVRPAPRGDPLRAGERRGAADPRRVRALRGDRPPDLARRTCAAGSCSRSRSLGALVNLAAVRIVAGLARAQPRRRGQLPAPAHGPLRASSPPRSPRGVIIVAGFQRADPIASLLIAALMVRSGVRAGAGLRADLPGGRAGGPGPRGDRRGARLPAGRRGGARPARLGAHELASRRSRPTCSSARDCDCHAARRAMEAMLHERFHLTTRRCRSTTTAAGCSRSNAAPRRRGAASLRPRRSRPAPVPAGRCASARSSCGPSTRCEALLGLAGGAHEHLVDGHVRAAGRSRR